MFDEGTGGQEMVVISEEEYQELVFFKNTVLIAIPLIILLFLLYINS